MRKDRERVEERRVSDALMRIGEDVAPPSEQTLRAMARSATAEARIPEAVHSGRPWLSRLRWVRVAAVAVVLGAGLGFGFATWLIPSGSATSSLGFGFLPSKGWTVVQSGTVGATGTAHAIAANVPLDSDGESSELPYATLRRLPPTGAVIVARLSPRGDERRDPRFQLRTLPLRLAQAVPAALPSALSETSLVSLRVRGGVAGYNVDARVFLGSPPSPRTVAAVDEQLRRLVVAPGGVTLVVQPRIIRNTSERLTIFGSVASGKADQKVTIQFRACGLQPAQFRDVFETTTRAGGGFSLAELRPFNLGVSGVFRALSGDSVSAGVPVQQRASVGLRALGGGRFQAWVSGVLPFWRRHVLLQRFERARGIWITVRRVVLSEQLGGSSGPAPSFGRTVIAASIAVTTEPFRPAVPKGTTIRVVFPLAQARPCYLAGYSQLRRT
jgi:hypothetical protein